MSVESKAIEDVVKVLNVPDSLAERLKYLVVGQEGDKWIEMIHLLGVHKSLSSSVNYTSPVLRDSLQAEAYGLLKLHAELLRIKQGLVTDTASNGNPSI